MLRDEFSPQNFGEPPPRRPLPPAPPQPGPAAVLSVRPRRRPPRPPPRLSSSAAGVQCGPACRAPCTAGVQGARPAACRGRLGQSGVGQAGPVCGARRRRRMLPPLAHGLAGSRAPSRACGSLRRRREVPPWPSGLAGALRGRPELPP